MRLRNKAALVHLMLDTGYWILAIQFHLWPRFRITRMQSEATGLPCGISRFFLAWYAEVAMTTSSIQRRASDIRMLNRGLAQTVS
ncbi:MAG: hypothetical protein QF886_05785 [Planctomycetota bacterium]|nr:hypothetical protein [Planctomycetota bacterium]